MKITTFSIVVGSAACDADCPFCISHMTGFDELPAADKINYDNLQKAIKLATMGGCTTCLLTGKGEPTLYPGSITNYLSKIGREFPLVELQTNGIRIGDLAALWLNSVDMDDFSEKVPSLGKPMSKLWDNLCGWRLAGLNTIALSVVDVLDGPNKTVYLEHRKRSYPKLETTVKFLHELGFTVRLCVMMQKPSVCAVHDVKRIVEWCQENEVAQLTMRPIRFPYEITHLDDPSNDLPYEYLHTYGLNSDEEQDIREWVEKEGTHLLTIGEGDHAFKIYDVGGQNLGLADCLTVDGSRDTIRTLIFYPDGRLTYDWQFKGARLL